MDIPITSTIKKCSFIMTKAKKTAEIGSKEASKLPLTAPTKEVPFKKAV